MLWLLRKLRKYAWADWLLTRAESYTALLEQYGILPYLRAAINAVVALVLGAWVYLEDGGIPIAIACAVVTFAALYWMAVTRSLHADQPHRAMTPSPEPPWATHADLVKLARAITEDADFITELVHLSEQSQEKQTKITILRDVSCQR